MAATALATRSTIGDAPKRREDARFLIGRGAYLDDLVFDRLTHAALLRSPHAHARIARLDVTAARAAPGVLAVLTGEDADADGLRPMLPVAQANTQTGEPFAFAPQPLLAQGTVRHVGEPVVLIVAETHAQALDAAERIAIEYDPLQAVVTAAAATAPGAPLLSPLVPGNLCMDWHAGDAAATEAAFAAAAHAVTRRLDNHRIVTNPMEPRGGIGSYDAAGDRYTLHVSSQNIHANRDLAARALGRAARPRAVHRPGCRRRLRRQELRLCRARAGPVGGKAGRSAGEMDRQPRARYSCPTIRPATIRPRRRWRSMRRENFWRCASSARRQHRRLHGGRRRRRANLPVHPSARHRLRHSGDRAAGAQRC